MHLELGRGSKKVRRWVYPIAGTALSVLGIQPFANPVIMYPATIHRGLRPHTVMMAHKFRESLGETRQLNE